MGRKLKMVKFDPDRTHPITGKLEMLGYFIVIVGKRGSGKTTVALDLMYHLQNDIDIAISVSETADVTAALNGVIPTCLQYNKATPTLITNLLKQQEADNLNGRCKNMLLFLDDVAWDQKFMKSEEFKRLVFNGRHRNITVIFTLQYAMELPPALRMNTDMCITMNEKIRHYRKNLHEQYFGMMSYEEFNTIMDIATKGYSCLVLDNRIKRDQLHEILFWYTVNLENTTKVKLGNGIYWKLDQHYGHGVKPSLAVAHPVKEKATVDSVVQIGEKIDVIAIARDDGQTMIRRRPHNA